MNHANTPIKKKTERKRKGKRRRYPSRFCHPPPEIHAGSPLAPRRHRRLALSPLRSPLLPSAAGGPLAAVQPPPQPLNSVRRHRRLCASHRPPSPASPPSQASPQLRSPRPPPALARPGSPLTRLLPAPRRQIASSVLTGSPSPALRCAISHIQLKASSAGAASHQIHLCKSDRAGHGHRQRRGEHGGRRPRVGRHQRSDAPRRACLGPPPALPSPLHILRHRRVAAVDGTPPNVAVLGAVRRQPLGIRRLLQPPQCRPDLRRCARHQCHHLRRHRCRRRPPWRGHTCRTHGARHHAHCPRRLARLLSLEF